MKHQHTLIPSRKMPPAVNTTAVNTTAVNTTADTVTMLDKLSVFSLGPYLFVKERIRKRKAAKLLEKAELTESLRREELFTATYCCQQTDAHWTELSWPRTGSCQPQPQPRYYQPQTSFNSATTQQTPSDRVYEHGDTHLLICTTFWRSSLTLSNYKWRRACVDFGSLWPNEDKLKSVLREARHVTSLRHAFGDLLRLCLRVGPLRVLKALIEESIVDKNAVLDNGRTLLHTACIHGNLDAVLYLCAMDVTTDTNDDNGQTAYEVCLSSDIRKLLPHQATSPFGSKVKLKLRPESPEVYRIETEVQATKKALTTDVRNKIFDLFHQANCWEELFLLLRVYEFQINEERDEEGDLLVHIAVQKGISHVGVLLGLIRHFDAACDVTNAAGCTPLMLAVCNDDEVMAEVLICILGADINFQNPETGWTALHYSVHLNTHHFVSLLVKRGANVNVESVEGLRADDIGRKVNSDSADYVQRARQSRAAQLSARAAKGTLSQQDMYKEDMFVVDGAGDTLIMTAVSNNQPAQLATLLRRRCAPIDGQNYKTGKTALAIAAQEGQVEAIHILLRSGAAVDVADMAGRTAIDWAVTTNQEPALLALLEYPTAWVGLQGALEEARTRRIRIILTRTIAKRQTNLVTPALFESAMTGSTQTLHRLLQDGDDINPSSCAHDWPVYIAAANGHLPVLQLLYQRGGDLCCRHQTSGNTALHVAAAGNHGSVINFLLEHYARAGVFARRQVVNERNADGKTALQAAADKGYIRIVESLLQGGASAAVTDGTGKLYQCRGFQGIQVLLDQVRRAHALQVFSALEKKSPVAHLQEVFVPDFDHNLRNDAGDTLLMVACRLGKLDAVTFLLQSAVPIQPALGPKSSHTQQTPPLERISGSSQSQHRRHRSNQSQARTYEEIIDGSPDTDSAVEMDYSLGMEHRDEPWYSQNTQETLGRLSTDDYISWDRTTNSGFMGQKVESESQSDIYDKTYGRNLYYRSGSIVPSYVCSRSTRDGATALHRLVESGDRVGVATVVLRADGSVTNIQDDSGRTALHVACQRGRVKVTRLLLSQPGVDVNLRTLEGHLAEELTTNKTLRVLLQQSRDQQTAQETKMDEKVGWMPSTKLSPRSAASIAGSNISFDGLNTRFTVLKERWLAKQRRQQWH